MHIFSVVKSRAAMPAYMLRIGVAFFLVGVGNFVYADDTPVHSPEPAALLAKMSAAMRELNYSGEFSYEHGNKLESFHISHFLQDDQEHETLYRLSGSEQQFVRKGATAGCGTIGGRFLEGLSLSFNNGQYFGLDRYYRSVLLGRDRVAGRYVWVVQLIPKDEFRFGVSLSIDEETHLLVRYVVYDPLKKVGLERLQFVSLTVGGYEPEPAIVDGATLTIEPQRCIGRVYTPDGQGPWKPAWLPPGFLLIGYEYTEEDGHMETYTDGLSSFSIFVKRLPVPAASQGRIQQGVTARGAVMALMSTFPIEDESLLVSIIGEIPLPAAQKVSLSMRKISVEGPEG